MTRGEFMAYAEAEVDEIVGRQKNRIMNVVSRAWAEGKKAAEIEGISEIVKAALEQTREVLTDERELPMR